MRVIKRSNILQNVSFDKITARIQYMSKEAKLDLDASIIAQKVCARIYDGIKTSEIDELTSQVCTTLVTENIQYGKPDSTEKETINLCQMIGANEFIENL